MCCRRKAAADITHSQANLQRLITQIGSDKSRVETVTRTCGVYDVHIQRRSRNTLIPHVSKCAVRAAFEDNKWCELCKRCSCFIATWRAGDAKRFTFVDEQDMDTAQHFGNAGR